MNYYKVNPEDKKEIVKEVLGALGKHHYKTRRPYLGIALIAFAPPPRTQTGTLGHFLRQF